MKARGDRPTTWRNVRPFALLASREIRVLSTEGSITSLGSPDIARSRKAERQRFGEKPASGVASSGLPSGTTTT
jgi:hypothetical protein